VLLLLADQYPRRLDDGFTAEAVRVLALMTAHPKNTNSHFYMGVVGGYGNKWVVEA
jgi:hypothetical protein